MPKKKVWETRWKVTSSPTKSGGQGVVYFVEDATETTGGVFVLKELKQQNDVERRSRMRREVVALETLPYHSVPKFIESNTDKYEDLSVKLYAVFEYIPGPTLGDFVKGCAETISLNDAIAVVDGILNVVEFYHSNGVGHRDIKPANIILRDGQCSDPILLDFGLTFNTNDEEDHITWDGQSVGNRFLGLPEHATTSVNKRDLRSDITFCVGLLFYLMTGTDPSILSDHNNQLPHQRPGPRSKIELIPEPQKILLLHLFDQGFRLNLNERWQTIPALRAQLDRLKMNEAELAKTDDHIAHLKVRAGVHKSNKTTFDALNTVRDWVESAAENAVVRLGAGYKPSIEKRLTNMERADTWIRCGVDAFLEGKTINTFFLIKAIGDEIVIEELRHQGKREVKARVPIAKPDYVPELHDIIVDTIILNVSNELSET